MRHANGVRLEGDLAFIRDELASLRGLFRSKAAAPNEYEHLIICCDFLSRALQTPFDEKSIADSGRLVALWKHALQNVSEMVRAPELSLDRALTSIRLLGLFERLFVAVLQAAGAALAVLLPPHSEVLRRDAERTLELLLPAPALRACWQSAGAAGSFGLLTRWDSLAGALSRAAGSPLDAADLRLCRALLDPAGSALVPPWRVAALAGWGSPPVLLQRLRETCLHPAFHGFLSSREAERALSGASPGAFLLRLARASAAAPALAFVDEARQVRHAPVLLQGGAWAVPPHPVQFGSLDELLQGYASTMRTPVPASGLPRTEASFFGEIDRNEATVLLRHADAAGPGSFLIRYSSRPGLLVCSALMSGGQVSHFSLELATDGRVRPADSPSATWLPLRDLRLAIPQLESPLTHPLWDAPVSATREPHPVHPPQEHYAPISSSARLHEITRPNNPLVQTVPIPPPPSVSSSAPTPLSVSPSSISMLSRSSQPRDNSNYVPMLSLQGRTVSPAPARPMHLALGLLGQASPPKVPLLRGLLLEHQANGRGSSSGGVEPAASTGSVPLSPRWHMCVPHEPPGSPKQGLVARMSQDTQTSPQRGQVSPQRITPQRSPSPQRSASPQRPASPQRAPTDSPDGDLSASGRRRQLGKHRNQQG